MNNSVGQIALDLVLNEAQFRQELVRAQKTANETGEKMAASFKKVGTAITGAFSAAAIIKFGKDSIESAAKVQAGNAQLSQTFGALKNDATDAMQRIADESGILKTRLQGVGTDIYAFAKTSGMDSANALNMMEEALRVTADSAAYYDRSLEDTAESLKSFLKGNYANDAALGISCTETTRNAAANRLYGKSFKDLSEAQKQLTLLQMVKDANALSGAMGQAARESDGWENILGNLRESWNQLLAVIGKPILQGAVFAVKAITSAIQELAYYAAFATDALSELFGWSGADAEATGVIAADTRQTAEAIARSADDQQRLTKETKKTSDAAKNGLASFDRLNVLSRGKSGTDSDMSAAGGASAVFQKPVQKSVANAANGFKNIFSNLYEESGFKAFVDNLRHGIDKVDWNAVKDNFKSIFNDLKPIAATTFTQVKLVGRSAFGALGSAAGAFATVGGKSIQTVSGGVARWLSKDQEKIQGFITTISGNFSEGFDNVSKVFDDLGTVIGGSIDRMRPDMEEAISNLLDGLTDFAGGIGEVVSGAFAVGTESIVDWVENDGAVIGEFFDTLQAQIAAVFDTVGTVAGGIGQTLSEWWNGNYGREIFKQVCDMFLNIGTTFMNVYNQWIKPAWEFFADAVQSAWNNCLKSVFEKILDFFGAAAGLISDLWNNWLLPLFNWVVETFGPTFETVFGGLRDFFSTVFDTIGSVIGVYYDKMRNLIDFIRAVFSLDWKMAWLSIKRFFHDIWNGIWEIVKNCVNLIIDGLNLLWSAIYGVIAGIVNGIGGVVGLIGDLVGQDWDFSMPEEPPKIPKLAAGGIVKAPTLAVVGDNPRAGSGDPEVVSPLSKLQSLMRDPGTQDTALLAQILDYLRRLYETFVIYKNSGEKRQAARGVDASELFNVFVEINEIYKDTHDGVSAFA